MAGSEDRKGFILYRNYIEPVNQMSDEQAGQLFKAVLAYVNGLEVPKLDASAVTAFYFIKSNLDMDSAKYEKRCAANRENGKKGGRPRKNAEPQETEQKPPDSQKTEKTEPEKPKAEEPKRKTKKEKDAERLYNSRAGKIAYAELVYLTESQYQRLVDKYGSEAAEWMVQKLDNYKGSKKKVYYDDYRAILNWVVGEWENYIKTHPNAHTQQKTTDQKTEPDTDEQWERYFKGEQ